MKNLVIVLFTLMALSCSTEKNQEQVIRDLAKNDAIEKLQLPDGTSFADENIQVSETETDGPAGINYLVKITVNSQDRDGNEIVKTYSLNYKKTGEGGLAPEDYELLSFE